MAKRTIPNVHMTLVSSNRKTGKIPVTTTSAESCPSACPFKKNGCYADGGPLGMHWLQVTKRQRGENWRLFLGKIAGLPDGQFWRHNKAGDLPGFHNNSDGNHGWFVAGDGGGQYMNASGDRNYTFARSGIFAFSPNNVRTS